MRYSSLLVFLLLMATMMLMGFNTSHVEGKLSTTFAPPKPAPTVTAARKDIRDIDSTLEDLDAYSARNRKKIEVDVKGRDESNGQVIIKLNDPTAAPELQAFAGGGYLIDLSLITVPENYILGAVSSIFGRDPKASSCPGVAVRQIGGNTPMYEVTENYPYTYKGTAITVPKGFRYDRASIPRVFWVLIDKDSLSNVAPLFHDLLYRHGGVLDTKLVTPYRKFKRDDADNLFYELMGRCGVEEWRRTAAYEAVHRFAKSHWNGQ